MTLTRTNTWPTRSRRSGGTRRQKRRAKAEKLIAKDRELLRGMEYASFNIGKEALEKGKRLDEGRHEEALACYERAMQNKPVYPVLYCAKGASLGMMNRDEEALKHISKGLRLMRRWCDRAGEAPDGSRTVPDPSIYSDKAAILRRLGRHEQALKCIGEAHISKEFGHVTHADVASILYEMGRHADAISHCDSSLGARPGFAPALHVKAGCLEALGRMDEASKCRNAQAA